LYNNWYSFNCNWEDKGEKEMNIHTLDKRKKEAMCSEPTDDKRVSSFGEHETHIAFTYSKSKGLEIQRVLFN